MAVLKGTMRPAGGAAELAGADTHRRVTLELLGLDLLGRLLVHLVPVNYQQRPPAQHGGVKEGSRAGSRAQRAGEVAMKGGEQLGVVSPFFLFEEGYTVRPDSASTAFDGSNFVSWAQAWWYQMTMTMAPRQ